MAENVVQAPCPDVASVSVKDPIVLACAIKKKKKNKRIWARQWLLRRQTLGSYQQIFRELATEDGGAFRNYMRLPVTVFHTLLEKNKAPNRKTGHNNAGKCFSRGQTCS